MSLEIKPVKTKKQFKDFLRIFDYWHKQGKLGFVPIFILYRVKDQGQLSLLVKNAKTIGIAWMIPRKRPYEFYQLKTYAIDRDWIGKGYGEKFLKKLIDPLHKAGYDITTGVLTDNKPAIKLYKKMGFKTTEKVKSAKGIETYEMIYKATKPKSSSSKGTFI